MADDNARLRDAFAQLLAINGQGPAPSPIEAMWAQQGKAQMPPPPGPPIDPSKDFTGQAGTSMPRPPSPPGLNFPTAPAAPGSLLGGPREPSKPPFPGAKSVEVKPYGGLPKSDKKPEKSKKGDKG